MLVGTLAECRALDLAQFNKAVRQVPWMRHMRNPPNPSQVPMMNLMALALKKKSRRTSGYPPSRLICRRLKPTEGTYLKREPIRISPLDQPPR